MTDLPVTPPGLRAVYETGEPDQAIPLYEGALRIQTDEGESIEGTGSIVFEWIPYPQVEFTLAVPDDFPFAGPFQDQVDGDLTFEGGAGGRGRVRTRGMEMTVRNSTAARTLSGGLVSGALLIGNPAPTEGVVFHIPNFPMYIGDPVEFTVDHLHHWSASRLAAIADDRWQIDIDAARNESELRGLLNNRSGYGLTHVGRLTRVDRRPVAFEDVEAVLEAIYWWLSLIRGSRTGPMLVAGIHGGEKIWEVWRNPSVADWRGRQSWLPIEAQAADTSPLISGLWVARADPDLSSTLARAVDWYTQSIETTYLDTKVVLAQAGLELMCWLGLVKDVGVTEDAFGKLTAADRLRLALRLSSVDPAVPDELGALSAAAGRTDHGLNELDGPGAVTEIRNSTVHPKSNDRFSDSQAIFEGARLATRYLELLILHRLGYVGPMFNRATGNQSEPVPWARSPTSD